MVAAILERLPRVFKSFASLLQKKPPEAAPAAADSAKDEDAPIYESLALTEELREALFPTRPRMVSAIFERPLYSSPLTAPAPQTEPAPPLARDSGSFPIV